MVMHYFLPLGIKTPHLLFIFKHGLKFLTTGNLSDKKYLIIYSLFKALYIIVIFLTQIDA